MHPVTLHSAAYAAADVHSNPNRQSVGAGWYVCAHLWTVRTAEVCENHNPYHTACTGAL
jgi:hypothetical protein